MTHVGATCRARLVGAWSVSAAAHVILWRCVAVRRCAVRDRGRRRADAHRGMTARRACAQHAEKNCRPPDGTAARSVDVYVRVSRDVGVNLMFFVFVRSTCSVTAEFRPVPTCTRTSDQYAVRARTCTSSSTWECHKWCATRRPRRGSHEQPSACCSCHGPNHSRRRRHPSSHRSLRQCSLSRRSGLRARASRTLSWARRHVDYTLCRPSSCS